WAMARSTRESYRMTSRLRPRASAATASRAPSLPRRRRWPSPTGANTAERQPDLSPGREELARSARSSAMPGKLPLSSSGGENLGLLALELLGGDDAPVAQVGQLGQLVGRVRTACGVLDVAT